jgi:hypothetical protein
MPARGKTVALTAALAAFAVLAGAAYASRDVVREHWYIFRLHSTDRDTQTAAARQLAALRSLRAVPHLLEAIRRDDREGVVEIATVEHVLTVNGACKSFDRTIRLATPLVFALWQIGDGALPSITSAMDDETDERMRRTIRVLLDRNEPLAESPDALYPCR